ncbi:hypothetical protein G2W53_005877 [Senna tora]|uniref:Uncharacterized protein n=1 Tax=Senna tora TaxID=362788 RepID=A0A834X3H1_9FABA|nr:hypothetical protein G2W53_005877 [Senna tora]
MDSSSYAYANPPCRVRSIPANSSSEDIRNSFSLSRTKNNGPIVALTHPIITTISITFAANSFPPPPLNNPNARPGFPGLLHDINTTAATNPHMIAAHGSTTEHPAVMAANPPSNPLQTGIDEISYELSSLRNGATGDSGGGDSKSPLIEEIAVIEAFGGNVVEVEGMTADEGVGGGTEGESEAEEVVEEAAGGGVEDVGEHDVHGVFGANGAGAEHGEAELHGEDEVGGEEEVGVVEGIGGVGEVVGDDFKLIADEVGGGASVGDVGTKVRRKIRRACSHGE